MSDVNEIAQKLIPCTCGGYGQDKRRHMTDCARHAIAWEQPGDRLVGVECRMPRFRVRRFRCPLKAHRWAYLFALKLWREYGKPAQESAT